jgi:hypothetical protein
MNTKTLPSNALNDLRRVNEIKRLRLQPCPKGCGISDRRWMGIHITAT